MGYPRARTREASAAAAPLIPLPFRIATEVEPRGRSGLAGALAGLAGLCLAAASARAWWITGFASIAAPTTTSPISSSVAIPAATTAIVRQEWLWGLDRACSTGIARFAAAAPDPSRRAWRNGRTDQHATKVQAPKTHHCRTM